MGYVTPVIIRNDCIEAIRREPQGFVRSLLEQIDAHDFHGGSKGLDVSAGNYGSVATALPSNHASVDRLLLVHGNTIMDLARGDEHDMPNLQAAEEAIETAKMRMLRQRS